MVGTFAVDVLIKAIMYLYWIKIVTIILCGNGQHAINAYKMVEDLDDDYIIFDDKVNDAVLNDIDNNVKEDFIN